MLARIERLFWTLGLAGLAYVLFLYCNAEAYQRRPIAAGAALHPSFLTAPSIIGRLEIPNLSLSVPILSSYDPDSLRKGVGHIPGTALPGGLGTVALAGHRDTFFRPLRKLSKLNAHMEIHLVDGTGTYRYGIDSTEIVTPDKIDVLAMGTRPELVLITCFPFDYIGAAPKRFIVHAHLLSASPDSPKHRVAEEPHEVPVH